MPRYIDADVLRMSIEKDRDTSEMPKMWYEGIAYAINHIIHAPTVEVVRCEDCKYFRKSQPLNGCTKFEPMLAPDEDDFCSCGERKETEEDRYADD